LLEAYLAKAYFFYKSFVKLVKLRMRSITWNRFLIKRFADRFLAYPFCGEYL